MRKTLIALATFVSLLPAQVASAEAPTCKVGPFSDQATCGGSDGASSSGSTPTRRRSTTVRRQPSTPRYALVYTGWLRRLPDGSRCYLGDWGPIPVGELSDHPDLADDLANAKPCPDPAARPATPQVAAREFWETVTLPRPEPVIRPGKAIAGKDSYLEIDGPLTARFTVPNPLGGPPIVVDALATYVVDWGDGTTTSTSSQGGSWPDGDVTHVWTDAGAYDVVVTQLWTARWAAGDVDGVLDGLRTVGRIDGFPVREVQAVRTR